MKSRKPYRARSVTRCNEHLEAPACICCERNVSAFVDSHHAGKDKLVPGSSLVILRMILEYLSWMAPVKTYSRCEEPEKDVKNLKRGQVTGVIRTPKPPFNTMNVAGAVRHLGRILSTSVIPTSATRVFGVSIRAYGSLQRRANGMAMLPSLVRCFRVNMEPTPNPDSMKFVPEGKVVLPEDMGTGLVCVFLICALVRHTCAGSPLESSSHLSGRF
jgi:hypothetical protein